MNARHEILADADALADRVADRFLALVVVATDQQRDLHVVLTGGTVARLVHRAIADRAAGQQIDWSRVHFWFGDERFVAADSPERNAGQARDDLLDGLAGPQIHEIPASDAAASVDTAADAYAALLGAVAPTAFDLVMLGMGPDSHIASLFPGAAGLQAAGDTVAVPDSPKPPPQRVSLTLGRLNRAREVWFLVSGLEKAEALARAWADDGTVTETPPRGIVGPQITWFTDLPASGQRSTPH